VGSGADAPEADRPAERVTLRIPTDMAAPSHALILREGPKPTRPRGRIPRVARLLALAHHFQELIDTRAVETQAELAEFAKLTPARVTQIMNLLGLAPDIQEEIFFLPPVTEGQPAISERHMRQVLQTVVWSEQRERWAALRQQRVLLGEIICARSSRNPRFLVSEDMLGLITKNEEIHMVIAHIFRKP
jgi:hypothetical protein